MSTLHIKQGATYQRQWKWCEPVAGSDPPVADESSPIDITGYTARLQIRRRLTDTAVLLDFDDTDGLVVDGAAGSVALEITDTQTTALTARSAVWDLEVESPGGVVTRLDGGEVDLSPEVTRPVVP